MTKPAKARDWIVIVSYDAKHYFADNKNTVDRAISELASKHGGQFGGAGMGFGVRDMSLYFPSEETAKNFQEIFENSVIKRRYGIKLDCIMEGSDY